MHTHSIHILLLLFKGKKDKNISIIFNTGFLPYQDSLTYIPGSRSTSGLSMPTEQTFLAIRLHKSLERVIFSLCKMEQHGCNNVLQQVHGVPVTIFQWQLCFLCDIQSNIYHGFSDRSSAKDMPTKTEEERKEPGTQGSWLLTEDFVQEMGGDNSMGEAKY